ncbi:MAG: hypothetical protein H0T07_05060 [Actinobacteria bacterium]|nr:hypothetical protein [Actinomycetota bacterium]
MRRRPSGTDASPVGESLAAAAAIALIAGGLWLGERPSVPASPEIARDRAPFVERALFCPPAFDAFAGDTALAVQPLDAAPGAVAVEPGGGVETGRKASGLAVTSLPGESPVDVVGYGAPVSATAVAQSEKGSAAAPCATEAARRWYFADGSSALGWDERIVISNPFPDEAVARVVFFTPSGAEAKANLADIPVSAGEAVAVKVNDFILREPVLAASVDTLRGRVVAWKATLKEPNQGVSGAAVTLGAPKPARHWYLPAGAAGKGARDRISILNPSEEEAIVNVTLHTASEAIQSPDLTEVSVPASSAMTVPLEGAPTKEDGGAGVIVESIGGAGVVVEHAAAFDSGAITGYLSEGGLPAVSTAWSLPPAALHPRADDVVVLNPGPGSTFFDIALVATDGTVTAPARLSEIELEAGARLSVSVARWTEGKSVGVELTSTRPTAVERVAYSPAGEDMSSTTGLPLP